MTTELKIDPYGFREYDARWVYEKDINQLGIENLGKGLGTQIIKHTKKTNPRVIVGHDYRSYSEEIKSALKKGLLSTGCNIEDIGLSLSPTVYFAQFNLDADAVAMVTASHNENGWTGVKMGIKKGLTHAPEEMKELKEKKEKAQPTRIKTSGSTFKNPIGQSDKKVWQLIKESVSIEKSFGDACISEKHCNFFVNKGNAEFKDMKKLIEFVSESVLKKTGVKLETEIKILE